MRDRLRQINGMRARFRAIVGGFGERTSKGHPKPMILLKDVRNLRGDLMTDHVWFDHRKWVDVLGLKEGDEIEFDARVGPYWKGYIDKVRDYKLNHPSRIVKRNMPMPDIPDRPRLPMLKTQERLFA